MKKFSYKMIQNLVLKFREQGYNASVCRACGYIGVRIPAIILNSDELSLISRCFCGNRWFIERDSFNSKYYFVSTNESNLR